MAAHLSSAFVSGLGQAGNALYETAFACRNIHDDSTEDEKAGGGVHIQGVEQGLESWDWCA